MTAPPATWRTPTEAVRIVCSARNICRTSLTALVVGTVLFAINQLDIVIAGHATTGTWIKSGLTFLVPFCVANIGLLIGCHGRRDESVTSPP